MQDTHSPNDLSTAKKTEGQRKLKLLGDLVHHPYDADALHARAKAVFVRPQRLKAWLDTYRRDGPAGLEPDDWTELTPDEQEIARARYVQLQPYCDMPNLSTADIAELSDRLRWKFRRTKEWIERYSNGGLWGLTARFNPEKPSATRKSGAQEPSDFATLDESDIEIIHKKLEILGPLAEDRPASDEEIAARAVKVGISVRTIRNYRSRKRDFGSAGLARKTRSDRGKTHKLSERMQELVLAICLAYPEWPLHQIHATAIQKADELGETPPSPWQVRRIMKTIPKPIKLLASGRNREFKNLYRQTFPIHFEGTVYQIDHTPIDVLVVDKRNKNTRTASGEIRPHLTLVMDSRSRCVIAFHLGYDRPDQNVVKAVIRKSVLANPGGIPNQIWIDNGKDLVAREVQILAQELDIELNILAPQQPQHKGIVERFFGILNTRLWATLEGYVNSNTSLRNPTAVAKLVIQEIYRLLAEFIEKYNNEVHTSIGMTPIEFWRQNCFAMPVSDIHMLDAWMLSSEQRRIGKEGIRFDNRTYIHEELGMHVGKTALIRADTVFGAPDQIEVYVEGRHVCSAFAQDSERGRALTRKEMADYIRNQRDLLRQPIEDARKLLVTTEQEIEEARRLDLQMSPKQEGASDNSTEDKSDIAHPDAQATTTSSNAPPKRGKSKKKPNLLELTAMNLDSTSDEVANEEYPYQDSDG